MGELISAGLQIALGTVFVTLYLLFRTVSWMILSTYCWIDFMLFQPWWSNRHTFKDDVWKHRVTIFKKWNENEWS